MKRTGKAWIVTIAVTVIVMGSSMAMAGIFDAWDFSMKITFSGYEKPETLTNFPALVVLSTNIDNFSYTNFYSASGADLRFAASNETTELNYEIEKWDTNGESFVWVQVPDLASTNDFIYAYWGNSSATTPAYTTNGATWSEGYAAVWHLGESDAMAQDSTSNNNAAASVSGLPASTNGIIADANDFVDAESDYITVNASSDFDMSGTFTVNAWVYSRPNAGNEVILGCYNPGWILALRDTTPNNELDFYANSSAWKESGTAVSQDTWSHVAFVYNSADDPNDGKFYINGVNVATIDMIDQTGNDNLNIGANDPDWSDNRFEGVIDEARVSSVARSSNWIWACWLNQGSNDVFISYDTVDPNATNLAVATRPASDIGPTNATLNGKVLHTGNAENPYVYFCWDYTDKGTMSTGVWSNVGYVGTNWGKGELFATNLTSLISGSNYTYRCYVTNSTGEDWSDDAQSFTTIYLPSVTNTGATNIFRQVATLQGEITDTGGDTPYVWFYYWIDGGSTSPAAIGPQSGAFSEYVSGLTMGTNYTYRILASNVAGAVWSGEKSFETLSFGTGTNIWTGEGVTADWFEHENWSAGGVPLAGEHVIVTNVTTAPVLTNSTPDLGSFTITNETLTFTNWTTTLTASNVTVQSFGKLTLPGDFTDTQMSNRVHIVCTNLTVEPSGVIDANAMGYSYENGPGKGDYRSGAGYGGKGGDFLESYLGGSTYGSTNAPLSPGSGGGQFPGYVGGAGGGAIRIEATGNVTVNGEIRANGGVAGYACGGASGGGIFITCNTFGGGTNGIICANGGNMASATYGGQGGGGRIVVQYQNLQGTPSVRFSASPGSGYASAAFRKRAELGTLYFPNTNMLSTVLADMSGYLFASNWTSWAPSSLTISNCQVGFEKGFQLNIGGDMLVVGTNADVVLGRAAGVTNSELTCGGNMVLTNGGSLTVYCGQTNGLTVDYGALVSVTGNMWIGSNSWVYPCSDAANGGSVLFRMNDLMISTNAGFYADSQGYAYNQGPGTGGYRSGAGYGGKGGDFSASDFGGSTYGSTNAPLSPGSGGGSFAAPGSPGGAGGGAIRIESTGNVTVNGEIRANGKTAGYASGGGSGGGIFITCCNTFGGGANGIICASGGNGDTGGGGGGGGRIAVWYGVPEAERQRILDGDMKRVSITNDYAVTEFQGSVSVTNGTGGYSNGVPGTIVFLTVTPPSGTMFMCQ